MNLLPKAEPRTNKNSKGVDTMEIGNISKVKEDVIVKATNKKDKNNPTKNQGCIKMNDYFAF